MKLLADCEWLTRLEKEFAANLSGPARKLAKTHPVFINTISQAEYFSGNPSAQRKKVLSLVRRLPTISYAEATQAAALRYRFRQQGRALGTPDAFMAVSAMAHQCRLVTADKDFSGIPGLEWSAYPPQGP